MTFVPVENAFKDAVLSEARSDENNGQPLTQEIELDEVNSFHVIRNLPLRVTPIFANKNHALNTLKMGPLLRNNVMLP
jgi:hypothetical protein